MRPIGSSGERSERAQLPPASTPSCALLLADRGYFYLTDASEYRARNARRAHPKRDRRTGRL